MPWPQGPLGQVPTPVAQTLGSETLAQLAGVTVPPRDRIDLAQRLLGLSDVPQPPTTAPPELDLGAVVTFWADNLDEDYAFQVDAELVYKTAHVYMFVEVGQPVDLAAVQRSADAFEEVIRPRVHQVFGTEWTPGIDGDPHLVILHASGLGNWVAAYYGSNSAYPAAAVANSNEREMFYVNLDTMGGSIGTWYYEGVLAHEFQHMVHWHVDPNEDTWLNEGLSELATLITGYGPSDFTWSATSGRGSVEYTIAPRLPAVPIAARPATPAPATSTLAGGTLPAAVTWPVKKRPNTCAASTTAR